MIVVQNPQECDVLVIGGGPAGSTTAMNEPGEGIEAAPHLALVASQ